MRKNKAKIARSNHALQRTQPFEEAGRASKRSFLDSVLDKVLNDLFRRGDRKPRRPSFALEVLEPRLLLSADPGVLAGGVLTGNLTAQANNTVVALNRAVTPDGVASDGGLIIDLTVNGVQQQYGDAEHGVTNIVLQGHGGNDDFTLVDALSIGVTIDGGAGSDTIHGPAVGTEWTINGAGSGSAKGITSFTGIENLVGGGGADTLIGPSGDQTWSITGANAGSVAGISFTNIQTLQGASDNKDTFLFEANGRLDGAVRGGDGGYDTVVLNGVYKDVAYEVTGAQSGAISLDGVALRYDGMEPVQFTQAAGVFTYVGTTGNDAITLSDVDDAAGVQMQIAGTGETVQFVNPTDKLVIKGGAGDDTIHVQSLDPAYAAGLVIDGEGGADRVDFNSSVHTDGGELSVSAETIDVSPDLSNPTITLDTRRLNGGGATAGDSGEITLEGKDISISHGEFLASVDTGSGFEAGAVEIKADDSAIRQSSYFSPVFVASKGASIAIEDSSIHAGEVTITATAEDKNLYDDLGAYVDKLVGNGFGLLGQVPSMLTGLISGIAAQVSVRASSATIALTGSEIESSAAVDITAEAVANSSFHTVAVSSPLQQFITLAIGYGEAQSKATATITDSTITADEKVTIDTGAESEAEVKARSSVNPFDVIPGQANQSAFSVAIGNTSETSQILVDQNSAVTSRHGAVEINAKGEVVNFDWAEPTIYGDGTVGIGVALSIDKANISARVDGTIDAFGGSEVSFDPSGVQTAGDSISLPDLPFEENQAVVFHAPASGTAVGGLTDGETYYVHVVDPATGRIQLTSGTGIDLDNDEVDPMSTQTISRIATKEFAGEAVDPNSDTITFSGLPDGTRVTYIANSNDPDTDAGRGIGGLVQGHDYCVARQWQRHDPAYRPVRGGPDGDRRPDRRRCRHPIVRVRGHRPGVQPEHRRRQRSRHDRLARPRTADRRRGHLRCRSHQDVDAGADDGLGDRPDDRRGHEPSARRAAQ